MSLVAARPAARLAGDSGSPPNIVLIFADDLDLDLGTVATMPNLQALVADQGITLSNFFVNASICCPSRASMLRGQYVHNTGVLTNGPPQGGFESFRDLGLENDTLATRLRDAGYQTALYGKYLNRYPADSGLTYIPPGWDEWVAPAPTRPGYDQFNYTLNDTGTLVAYGSDPEDYLQDVLAAKATDFITRTVADGDPFFVYFATFSPHAPSTPAPRHSDLFTDTIAPRTPSFNEADVSDKPAGIRDLPLLTDADIQQIDEAYRKWLQSMQAVDEFIASLVSTLDATGQLDNTYILFSSDNGYHMGQHRLMPGKYLGYEEDIRVPLYVRGPGVPMGETRTELAGLVDLGPTFAEIAGIPVPDYMDGRSLLPLLGPAPPAPEEWRQAFLFEQYVGDHRLERDPLGEPPDLFDTDRFENVPLFYSGLRTATLKYVEYDNGERELYDLVADPYELDNIYPHAAPNDVALLSYWLFNLHTCFTDGCRNMEMQPPSPVGVLPPACAALDFDGDLAVSVVDIGLLLPHWEETPQSPGWDARFDLNGDSVIDSADIVLIANRWSEVCLPEP
ncbi:MAG: sulfatase-like hydrolase/transferase [Caldilineales bacterium]